MSITTKTGDKGKTSLRGGVRINKDSLRIEALGTNDELCSFLGFAKNALKNRGKRTLLESVQEDLFIVGAEIATPPASIKKLKKRITRSDIARLEKAIDCLEKRRTRKGFCLPGKNSVSGILDVCRAVARRTERLLISLKRKKSLKNNFIPIYFNRLSDLLYLLARSYEKSPQRIKP